MKKRRLFALLMVMIVGLSGVMMSACTKDKFVVGIVQIAEHAALDAANKGFRDELTKLMNEKGKKIKFENKNAQGSKDTCTTIVDTFAAQKVNLILAIATPAAQAAASVTEEIPILFTAVTDPVEANLVKAMDKPEYNVSGTSDLNPVAQQFELIKELVPDVNKVAILYNTSEKNSEVQVNLAQAKCSEMGITLVKKGITELSELEATMNSIALDADIDAIYIPTDNLLANGAAQVHTTNLSQSRKLPIICGETSMNDLCGVATYGIDYYKLGQQTARMAYKILVEGAKITEMPVEYQEGDPELSINLAVAQEIGFTIPQSVLDKAAK